MSAALIAALVGSLSVARWVSADSRAIAAMVGSLSVAVGSALALALGCRGQCRPRLAAHIPTDCSCCCYRCSLAGWLSSPAKSFAPAVLPRRQWVVGGLRCSDCLRLTGRGDKAHCRIAELPSLFLR